MTTPAFKMIDMENTAANLQNIEQAKVEFQHNISALIEIQSKLSQRATLADSNKKESVFFSLIEVEVYSSHLLDTISRIVGNYDLINHANKQLVFSNRLLVRQVEEILTPRKL